MIYTPETLKKVWDAVKNRSKLKDVMAQFGWSKEEAIEAYHQACKLFGRGPRPVKIPKVQSMEFRKMPKKWKRAPAQYSNGGYLDTLNKYR